MKRYCGAPRFVAGGVLSLALALAACGGDGPSGPKTAAATLERAASNTDGQTAYAGSPVAVAPSVVVRGLRGEPVVGATVKFTVVLGGGSVEHTSAATNLDGVASAGQWTLGTAGPNEVVARTGTLPEVRFTATATAVPSSAGAFDITVRYISGATPRQREAVQSAVRRWRSVILNDVPNIPVSAPAGKCFPNQPSLNELVDDLLLLIDFVAIDGVGRTLGEAGPCYVRTDSKIPVVGYLKLDANDLQAMEKTGTLDDVVLHEVGHVLGIGTLWTVKELLTGKGTADPQFIGAEALTAYRALGGVASGVPVENTGGPGTRDGHWRESVFGNELMTGWVDSGSNPLSAMTVASLRDLGYGTSLDAASEYTLSSGALRSSAGVDLRGRERLITPRFTIDRSGQKHQILNAPH